MNLMSITSRLFLFILVFGFSVFPFIFFPQASTVYEISRVWAVLIWIEILFFVSLFYFFNRKLKKIDNHVFLFSLFLLGVAIVSSVFGQNFQHSLLGNYYRVDGILTLFHLCVFSTLIGFFFNPAWTKSVFKVFAFSAVILSVLALVEFFSNGMKEVKGYTFGQPNFLAGYLLICLPTIKFQGKKQWAALFFVITAIVLTQSFGAILGVGLFIIGKIFYSKKIDRKLFVMTLFAFLLGFYFFAYFVFKNSFIAESRERVWRKLIPAIAAKPLLGWGWANVDAAFQSVVWPTFYEEDIRVDKAHSTILEWFVTTGLIGGISYCVFLFSIGKRVMKKDITIFFIFMLFLYHSQTNVISMSEEIVFWFLVGLAMG